MELDAVPIKRKMMLKGQNRRPTRRRRPGLRPALRRFRRPGSMEVN